MVVCGGGGGGGDAQIRQMMSSIGGGSCLRHQPQQTHVLHFVPLSPSEGELGAAGGPQLSGGCGRWRRKHWHPGESSRAGREGGKEGGGKGV